MKINIYTINALASALHHTPHFASNQVFNTVQFVQGGLQININNDTICLHVDKANPV